MGIALGYKQWKIKQRLIELRQARKHWPNSEQDDARMREIDLLEEELKSLDGKE